MSFQKIRYNAPVNTLPFIEFNLLEGGFWFLCAILCYLACSKTHVMTRVFWNFLCIDFILFGLSDFTEAFYPTSFLQPGGEWLLVWKLLCIVGFVGSFGWYLIVRIRA